MERMEQEQTIDLPEGTKLTRQRAKQLNLNSSLKNNKTPSLSDELVRLLKDIFSEDEDDDEEYLPRKRKSNSRRSALKSKKLNASNVAAKENYTTNLNDEYAELLAELQLPVANEDDFVNGEHYQPIQIELSEETLNDLVHREVLSSNESNNQVPQIPKLVYFPATNQLITNHPDCQLVFELKNQFYYVRPILDPDFFAEMESPQEVESNDNCPEILDVDFTAPTKEIMEKIREKEYSHVSVPERRGFGFTKLQLTILRQQLMMNVQLTTQNYLQFYSHPHFGQHADGIRQMLNEMDIVCRRIEPIMGKVTNLEMAMKFCDDWKNELGKPTEENQQLIEVFRKMPTNFPTRIIERIVNSKVFCFPNLVPAIPYKRRMGRTFFTSSEKHFFTILFEQYQVERNRELTLNAVVPFIHKIFCPWRTETALIKLFSFCRNKKEMNPIKYFFKHKRPARVHHNVEKIDCDSLVAPNDHPEGTLPFAFNQYIFCPRYTLQSINKATKKDNPKVETGKNPQTVAPSLNTTPKIIVSYNNHKLELKVPKEGAYNNNVNLLDSSQNNEEVNFKNAADLPIIIDDDDECMDDNRNKYHENGSLLPIIEDQTRSVKKSQTPKPSTKSTSIKKPDNLTKTAQKRSLFPLSKQRLVIKKVKNKLHHILINANYSYDKHIKFGAESQISTKIFQYIKEFYIFVTFLLRTMRAAQSGLKRRKDPENDTKIDDELPSKRQKMSSLESNETQRLIDSNGMIIITDRTNDLVERDSHFAWNFFDKVEKTFIKEGNTKKVDKFISILNYFHLKRDTVADLYHKLEDLFLPDHPEFAELFLKYLLPKHAAQIGTFFEDFIKTNINNLPQILGNYFENHLIQLKKIYALLNELSSSTEGLSMRIIKENFLPLLKDNQLLINWFLQLFPNERIMEAYTKDLSFEKEISQTELGFESHHCNEIIDGRMCYENRIVLPSDLCFLVQELDFVKNSTETKSRRKSREPKITNKTDPNTNNISNVEDLSSKISLDEHSKRKHLYSSSETVLLEPMEINHETSTSLKEEPTMLSENELETPKKTDKSPRNSNSSESDTSHNLSIASTEDEIKTITWTRDEDKLILERVNDEDEKAILDELVGLMPNRAPSDIAQRFHFMVKLLKGFEETD